MNDQHIAQSQETAHDAFLSNVGSLLTQRVADEPSRYEAQIASNFASYLRNRRLQLKLSRAELAQQADATEFELYVLEEGMLLPRQIEYVLLRKLANALDEDVELFALILERDIAHVDRKKEADSLRLLGSWRETLLHSAKKRQGWALAEWLQNKQEMIQQLVLSVQRAARPTAISTLLSNPRSNTCIAALTCFVLIWFGAQSFLAEPLANRNDGQSSAQSASVDPIYVVEQRGSLEIAYFVYSKVDRSWPEHAVHFIVDQQFVATVSYIEAPMRRNRWGCDMSLGNEYGPCSVS